ncbi:MAG: cold shock domain-containing protein [Nanoarchaeota archaeon]
MKGTVKFFNEKKGFGFIAADGGKEYFVHQSSVKGDIILKDQDKVVFDVEDGERGPKAVHVSLDDGSASSDATQDETTEDETPEDSEDID